MPFDRNDLARYASPVDGSMLYGLRVVTDIWMTEHKQVRFPRSKKRRIRKKWAKRPENWRSVPQDKAYQIGDTLVMHPAMLERLKKQLASISATPAPPPQYSLRSTDSWLSVSCMMGAIQEKMLQQMGIPAPLLRGPMSFSIRPTMESYYGP